MGSSQRRSHGAYAEETRASPPRDRIKSRGTFSRIPYAWPVKPKMFGCGRTPTQPSEHDTAAPFALTPPEHQRSRINTRPVRQVQVPSLAAATCGMREEIRAATLSRPATSTDDARKLLTEKLSHSIMEHREELIGGSPGNRQHWRRNR
ncbi:hypothetical protein MTO96_011303 [Rhipicephalus appendiculatus]